MLKLVDEKDIKRRNIGKGSGKGNERGSGRMGVFVDYAVALKSVISFLRKEIDERKRIYNRNMGLSNGDIEDIGEIRVKAKDIIKEMGREFERKNPSSLIYGIRYVLFQEDIFLVKEMVHKDGSAIYVLRDVRSGDKLPDCL